MKKKNPNIKRRSEDCEQNKFKFDENEASNKKSKFKTQKSDGKFVKKPLEDDDTNGDETGKKRGAYVKQEKN